MEYIGDHLLSGAGAAAAGAAPRFHEVVGTTVRIAEHEEVPRLVRKSRGIHGINIPLAVEPMPRDT